MAASNNPFYIEPANPLQALMMGVQGYKQGQEYQRDAALDDAAKAIRAGDNNAAIEALFSARQIGPAIEFAKLGRQQDASNQFSKELAGVFGQPQQVQPAPQSPLTRIMSPPPQAQPGPEPGMAPAPRQGPSTNLTAPETTITGVDYGPITNPQTKQVIAQGAGYVPGSQAAPQGTIGPSPTMGGVPLDRAIPTLLKAASNPSLPKEQQETARMLLGKAMDQYPQQIRELEIFKQRPDLFQMAKDLKTAGATVINTAEGEQAAQTKARIEIDQHAVQDLGKKVASGRAAIPLLNQMMAINDKTPGGWAGAAAPYVAKAAQTLGVQVPEGASNAELFQAMTRQFIPSIRDPGATSNYEQSLYVAAVPNLSQSQDGRAKIASMMRLQIDRNAEILATYRRYVGKPELDQKLADLDNKPMFSEADVKYLKSKVENNGAQAGMPQGAKQAPDGKFYLPDPNRPGKYLEVR